MAVARGENEICGYNIKIIYEIAANLASSTVRVSTGNSPVLVETTLAFLSNVFGPDSLEGPHAAWGVDVTNNANTNDWRSLQNSDRLDNFFFIDLGSRPVDLTNNVSHTSFVAHETG